MNLNPFSWLSEAVRRAFLAGVQAAVNDLSTGAAEVSVPALLEHRPEPQADPGDGLAESANGKARKARA